MNLCRVQAEADQIRSLLACDGDAFLDEEISGNTLERLWQIHQRIRDIDVAIASIEDAIMIGSYGSFNSRAIKTEERLTVPFEKAADKMAALMAAKMELFRRYRILLAGTTGDQLKREYDEFIKDQEDLSNSGLPW